MANCKRYTNIEGAATAYRTRPVGECHNCAYFDPKNCGAHFMDSAFSLQSKLV